MPKYLCPVFLLFFLASCQSGRDQTAQIKFSEEVSSLYESGRKPFYHGIASGDPLTDRVIIWTRVTPEDSLSSIEVDWEIADNERFDPLFSKGSLKFSADICLPALKHSGIAGPVSEAMNPFTANNLYKKASADSWD